MANHKDRLKELLGKIAITTNTITAEDDINHYTVLELLNALRSNVTEINKILDNLDDEIKEEVQRLIDNGTLERLINDELLGEINSRIDEVNAQLSQISNYVDGRISKRNFKPFFGINAYWGEASDNVGSCWRATRERIETDIDNWESHTCDEFVIPIHVSYNSNTKELYVVENLDDMRYAVDYCNGLNISASSIKIHMQRLSKSVAESNGIENFKTQYKNILENIATLFENSSVKIMTVLNEVGWIYESDEYETFANECLFIAKKHDYLTGVTCAGFNNFYNIKKSVIDNSNKIFVNTYPRISSKKEKTDLADVLNGWKSNNEILHIKKIKELHPTKKIVISECGVQDYWIALISPETYSWNESDKVPTNGEAPNMYLIGLINTLNDTEVERVWWWYDLKWDVTKKTLNYYLNGVINHD